MNVLRLRADSCPRARSAKQGRAALPCLALRARRLSLRLCFPFLLLLFESVPRLQSLVLLGDEQRFLHVAFPLLLRIAQPEQLDLASDAVAGADGGLETAGPVDRLFLAVLFVLLDLRLDDDDVRRVGVFEEGGLRYGEDVVLSVREDTDPQCRVG